MRFYLLLFVLVVFSIFSCSEKKLVVPSDVSVSGAMKNVMKNGNLTASISLDTISNKEFLYGIGPGDSLVGEILINNGRSFMSYIEEGEIKMEETFALKSPFFVYANQAEFFEFRLPEYVTDEPSLNSFLDELVARESGAFVLKLKGTFDKVDFHVQNLPRGTKVRSSDDAHKGQAKFTSKDVSGEIIGFFSRNHQGIFTHHDSFIHLHYISEDFTEMGHVDRVEFNPRDLKLYLPKN